MVRHYIGEQVVAEALTTEDSVETVAMVVVVLVLEEVGVAVRAAEAAQCEAAVARGEAAAAKGAAEASKGAAEAAKGRAGAAGAA
jgi:hypothetical protein